MFQQRNNSWKILIIVCINIFQKMLGSFTLIKTYLQNVNSHMNYELMSLKKKKGYKVFLELSKKTKIRLKN